MRNTKKQSESQAEHSQFFTGVHHEPLSVIAMCIHNLDRLAFTIPRLKPSQTPARLCYCPLFSKNKSR